MNYLGLAFIAYCIAGTVTVLVNIRSVEMAMKVKHVEHPFEQTWVMMAFILSWPYLAWPAPRKRQHR